MVPGIETRKLTFAVGIGSGPSGCDFKFSTIPSVNSSSREATNSSQVFWPFQGSGRAGLVDYKLELPVEVEYMMCSMLRFSMNTRDHNQLLGEN
ncbi:UNVERIFIED_CONTAM: hypothetical protein Sradi_3468400 [Sesamum radiatum]|uniref:Uncharacterized protein n=1 Tax=Sesamum radiatum TaxID=300843 RepID=A0AAW2QEK6_SESRA